MYRRKKKIRFGDLNWCVSQSWFISIDSGWKKNPNQKQQIVFRQSLKVVFVNYCFFFPKRFPSPSTHTWGSTLACNYICLVTDCKIFGVPWCSFWRFRPSKPPIQVCTVRKNFSHIKRSISYIYIKIRKWQNRKKDARNCQLLFMRNPFDIEICLVNCKLKQFWQNSFMD